MVYHTFQPLFICFCFCFQVWSHKDYPLREVGKLTLNRNVDNYFNETEQAAFGPAHMPPGIEPSPDRVLQARLFSYDDAARYRVGTNYLSVRTSIEFILIPPGLIFDFLRDFFFLDFDEVCVKSMYLTCQ